MMRFFLGLVFGFTLTVMPALAAGPVTKPGKIAVIKSPLQQISMKMQEQSMRIQSALKAGKITAAQAKAMRDALQAARRKQSEFFRQNKKPVLTDAQQAQLNQMLDINAKNLPIDPLDSKKMPDDPFGKNAGKKMPVDPLEKNKMKMPNHSLNKTKWNRPPDPLEKNKAQMPDEPLDSKAANIQ
jgi:hypothetical protein